jgi:hypothetical protein
MKSIRLNQTTIITMPDAADQAILVNGKWWRFDYCDYGGPLWLNKNGEPRKCQVPTSKAVWDAFGEWLHTYKQKRQK